MHCLNCSSVMGFGVSHSNFPLLSVLKQFLVCSEKVHKRSFTSRGSFFGNVTEGISVNEKTFALGSQILLSGYSKFVLFPEFFYLKVCYEHSDIYLARKSRFQLSEFFLLLFLHATALSKGGSYFYV